MYQRILKPSDTSQIYGSLQLMHIIVSKMLQIRPCRNCGRCAWNINGIILDGMVDTGVCTSVWKYTKVRLGTIHFSVKHSWTIKFE